MGDPSKFDQGLPNHLQFFLNSPSPGSLWSVSFSSWCPFQSGVWKDIPVHAVIDTQITCQSLFCYVNRGDDTELGESTCGQKYCAFYRAPITVFNANSVSYHNYIHISRSPHVCRLTLCNWYSVSISFLGTCGL